MKTRNLLFVAATWFLLCVLFGMANAHSFSDESLDRAQRAIQHNNEMLMEQQRTEALRQQQFKDDLRRLREDQNQQRLIDEMQDTNEQLRQINRGY